MKLGVFSPVLGALKLPEALDYLKSLGVQALELGVGGSPGTAHANAMELDGNTKKLNELKSLFENKGIEISAISVHNNGVHPVAAIAKRDTAEFEAACRVAQALGVERVVTFSGCPGDGKGDKPNWVTCSWPTEFAQVLEYQWNDVLIPYWQRQAAFAKSCGVKVCFEMHPGFCVYNPATLLRLRKACGDNLGANLDPSHLIWQGIDPVEAVHALKGAIYFFHAKDTALNPRAMKINGVLDTKSYADESERSWIFRTVGYGNDALYWKKLMSALRLAGYDHVVSIEHEDSLMTRKEGLEKAVSFLQSVMITESNAGEMWWI